MCKLQIFFPQQFWRKYSSDNKETIYLLLFFFKKQFLSKFLFALRKKRYFCNYLFYVLLEYIPGVLISKNREIIVNSAAINKGKFNAFFAIFPCNDNISTGKLNFKFKYLYMHVSNSIAIKNTLFNFKIHAYIYLYLFPVINISFLNRFYIICCISMKIIKKLMATLVEGDLKASISIATTPSCRGGCYSILCIVPLYPWSVLYKAEC